MAATKTSAAVLLNGRAAEQAANDLQTAEKQRPPLELATTRLDMIKPKPIRWLIPGIIPLGKLVMFAGDGGNGKSTLTLSMTADLTRGRPCFGLDYSPPPARDVLLINCEDDLADT